ncbi:MAG: DUF86 domain-containing protein [bacterium]
MGKDVRVYLHDILEYSDRIIASIGQVTFDEFRNSLDLQDATMRRFEVVGEAVKRVPEAVRVRYPDIEWAQATGFRDVLAHDYTEIVIDDLFFTAKNDLPVFREQIRQVLEELKAKD